MNALFGKDASASASDPGTDIWGIRSVNSGLEGRFRKYARINKLNSVESGYVPLSTVQTGGMTKFKQCYTKLRDAKQSGFTMDDSMLAIFEAIETSFQCTGLCSYGVFYYGLPL